MKVRLWMETTDVSLYTSPVDVAYLSRIFHHCDFGNRIDVRCRVATLAMDYDNDEFILVLHLDDDLPLGHDPDSGMSIPGTEYAILFYKL
jgi:hypothetical protein